MLPADVQLPPADMQQIRLPVKEGRLTFCGRYLDSDDNDTGDRSRWAQLVAYKGFGIARESPGTFGREYYLLYAIGHSLVVHAADGCQGVLTTVSKFSELNEDSGDLEPCPDCNPDFPSGSPDARFRLEVTRYSHSSYVGAAAFIDALRKCANVTCGHRPHEGRTCTCGCRRYVKGGTSQIGQRLLGKLREADEEIAAALLLEVAALPLEVRV